MDCASLPIKMRAAIWSRRKAISQQNYRGLGKGMGPNNRRHRCIRWCAPNTTHTQKAHFLLPLSSHVCSETDKINSTRPQALYPRNLCVWRGTMFDILCNGGRGVFCDLWHAAGRYGTQMCEILSLICIRDTAKGRPAERFQAYTQKKSFFCHFYH